MASVIFEDRSYRITIHYSDDISRRWFIVEHNAGIDSMGNIIWHQTPAVDFHKTLQKLCEDYDKFYPYVKAMINYKDPNEETMEYNRR